jgi:DNA-binding LacI/PurR family transcriptional regulator
MDLTTVHQDASELAETAINRLIERTFNQTLAPRVIMTSVALVERKSVVAKSL